jgi:hypothetical protein
LCRSCPSAWDDDRLGSPCVSAEGLEANLYEDKELLKILRGQVPDGYEVKANSETPEWVSGQTEGLSWVTHPRRDETVRTFC